MQGRNLTCRNAVLDSSSRKHYSMKQAFTTIGWAGNSCVIGTASGRLQRSLLAVSQRRSNAPSGLARTDQVLTD